MNTKQKGYEVAINSDRVHLSLEGIPVETHLFSRYADKDQDGKEIAIGVIVAKALEINGGKVSVSVK
jgi:hypothetical protein